MYGAILNIPTIVRVPFGHMDDPLVLLSGVDTELEAQTNGHWHLHWPQRDPLITEK
jgi:muramoyltetrapeptide carboxypeptidase LdcA involved in peptidoglycan recycling